jgi:hypothetical protein
LVRLGERDLCARQAAEVAYFERHPTTTPEREASALAGFLRGTAAIPG